MECTEGDGEGFLMETIAVAPYCNHKSYTNTICGATGAVSVSNGPPVKLFERSRTQVGYCHTMGNHLAQPMGTAADGRCRGLLRAGVHYIWEE